jgi:hypothetical protein
MAQSHGEISRRLGFANASGLGSVIDAILRRLP